jgi:uncharacterized membrane protein
VRPSRPNFFPFALPFLVALGMVLAFVVAMVEIGALEYAYARIGIDRRYVFSLLFLSLFGSWVNIPVGRLPAEGVAPGSRVTRFGTPWVVPHVGQWSQTVVAVNLGGAVVPTLLSLYLLVRSGLWIQAALGVVVVTAIVHRIARPVPGMGIAVPWFLPPLAAAVTAIVLAPDAAPVVAYVAGTLGTLVGADLLNLGRIRGLGAPVVSIGGAGTFDGVFLTGILAVLLA